MKFELSRRKLLAASSAATFAITNRRATASTALKVAAVHSDPVENAWNSVLHKALLSAAAEGKIEYVFSENVAATDYPAALSQYAEQGNKLIVGESYATEAASRQVAANYPNTSFLMGSSGGPAGTNFGTFATWNYEATYLCGMLAAPLSKTGIYGAVGALPIPEVNALINAFRAGVKTVNPNAKFLVGFIETFFNPAEAREAGIAQIDAGADVLFGERIGTADAAKDKGIKSVGSLIDYTPRYPKTVFANAMWYFAPILNAAILDAKANAPAGKSYSQYSLMKNGGNDIVFAEDLIVPSSVAAMQAKRAAIKSGAFTVPVDHSQPV
jgi:basic membrane lipoprotein Med (substrate-binding protein (PBP1-ABC) superfamily)